MLQPSAGCETHLCPSGVPVPARRRAQASSSAEYSIAAPTGTACRPCGRAVSLSVPRQSSTASSCPQSRPGTRQGPWHKPSTLLANVSGGDTSTWNLARRSFKTGEPATKSSACSLGPGARGPMTTASSISKELGHPCRPHDAPPGRKKKLECICVMRASRTAPRRSPWRVRSCGRWR